MDKKIKGNGNMTEEQKKLADSMFWWHRIRLSDDYVTPGMCPHGTGDDVETRFGLPKNMSGQKVLDIGTWDGLFAFESQKRGAKFTVGIDIYQKCAGQHSQMLDANEPFKFAKKTLNSKVEFNFDSLESYHEKAVPHFYDTIFHFGILYHIKNPHQHVRMLMDLIKEGGTILMETTISKNSNLPILEYRPGFESDSTNQYYPTVQWVEAAFKEEGAKHVECFYNDGIRATFRIKA